MSKAIVSVVLWVLPVLAGCVFSDEKAAPSGQVVTTKLTLGTGGLQGVYYPAGVAICDALKKSKDTGNLPCEAVATGGSAENLEALKDKRLELGLAQADTVYRAWFGKKPFKERFIQLRVLFSLHREMVSLIVHKSAGITSFRQVRGKNVNIGEPGSGNERVVSELLESCNISPGDFGQIGGLKVAEMPKAIKERSMDGYFYVIGHPNDHVAGVSKETPIEMLPLAGDCIDKLVTDRGYFDQASIPGGLYRGVSTDIPTFGVRAWVLASTNVSEDAVYKVVKAVFENIEEFRRRHPTFYRLSPKNMLTRFSVPYHSGAIKYYVEKGWYVLGENEK